MTDHARFSLRADNSADQTVECHCDGFKLQVRADGYRGNDDLVRLEQRNGRLVLLVWSDVNDHQPTHVIDLESARQQHRNEVIAEAKRSLRNESMSMWKEGKLFMRVYESINCRTGKQFTMREAASELDVEYARFRNHLMLLMPYDGPSITDEDRKRLLEAPATPSTALNSIPQRRPTVEGDR